MRSKIEDLECYLNDCFEQIPGLVMIDMEGIVFYVNEQCAEYFQKSKEEIKQAYCRILSRDENGRRLEV